MEFTSENISVKTKTNKLRYFDMKRVKNTR